MSIVTHIKEIILATIICAIRTVLGVMSFAKFSFTFSAKIVASIIERQSITASLWVVFATAPKRAFNSAVLPPYNKSIKRIAKATAY